MTFAEVQFRWAAIKGGCETAWFPSGVAGDLLGIGWQTLRPRRYDKTDRSNGDAAMLCPRRSA